MTRLLPGNPLLEDLSQRSLPHHKHKILVFMLYYELIHGIEPVTTKQVSEECEIDYNVSNQVLRRMKDYGLLKSKKGITTTYVIEDLSSKTGRTTVIRNDEQLPEGLEFDNLIIEKKRKRVVHWYLNDESRKYAKYIWFNPDKYKISEFVKFLVYQLLFKNKDNDYMDLVWEENQYKDVEKKNVSGDQKEQTSEVKPIYRTPDIEKYARILAAEHFKEQGYTVMEFEYSLFDCDLEIMKDFDHYKVIVKGLDFDQHDLLFMESEWDKIKKEKDFKICIVKMIIEGNPSISVISFC